METAMNRIERQAAFYRGYLADDHDLTAVVAVLVTGIALWLFFYLVSAVGPSPDRGGVRPPHVTTLEATRTGPRP
jgi:hypothetical protein